jgi:hypothetical protein
MSSGYDIQDLWAGFHDELTKIAIPVSTLLNYAAAGSAAGQLPHLPVFGNKSLMELVVEDKLKNPRTTPEKKEKLHKKLDKLNVAADSSPGNLIGIAGVPLGFAGARHFGKKLKNGILPLEGGLSVKEVDELKKSLGVPEALHFNTGNFSNAMAIPSGGTLPKFMRPLEKMLYEGKGLHYSDVEKAINSVSGGAFAPGRNPEVVAHELGHLSLRNNPLGKLLVGKGRALGPLLGAVGSTYMMSDKDPESWKVKAAPLAMLAGITPVLADEYLASKKGLNAIKKVLPRLAPHTGLMRGNLRNALGTYGSVMAGLGVLPIAAASASRVLMSRHRKNKQKGSTED